MSDTSPRRRIRAQTSPRDPETMRFILDAPVAGGRSASFDASVDGVPLAEALFAIAGVVRVQVSDETILVTRAPGHDWQALKPAIAASIRQVLDETDQPLGDPSAMPSTEEADAALLVAVAELIEARANPSIASHNGHVSAEAVRNGVVYLRMSGSCQGCAASAVTLRQGVETMLRASLPGIREIVDVTDHAGGKNPFYRSEPGQSPMLARVLPAGFIRWEAGRPKIDPAFLARRFGMRPDAFEAAMAQGEIVVATEAARGATRVTVRGNGRAWAAEIAPDGTAREIPPARLPRSDAADVLPARVRRHLEALPAERLPITYGRLARELGLYAPGSVRRITGALEATMREDAEAGRPFLAARVVSRATRLPGRGFFDLARALGHGPAPGETDATFHRRLMADSVGAQRVG